MQLLDSDEVIETLGLPHLRELSTFGALSDEVIVDLMTRGTIRRLEKNEYIARSGEEAVDFSVLLQGTVAYYKHYQDHDALTRHFHQGEQIGIDEMIAAIARSGTDVATETCLMLSISSAQFYELRVNFPTEFGIFMVNLARELSREIAMLEDVIVESTGWLPQDEADV